MNGANTDSAVFNSSTASRSFQPWLKCSHCGILGHLEDTCGKSFTTLRRKHLSVSTREIDRLQAAFKNNADKQKSSEEEVVRLLAGKAVGRSHRYSTCSFSNLS